MRAPSKPLINVRIERDVEKLVRSSCLKNKRSFQGEVNFLLFAMLCPPVKELKRGRPIETFRYGKL